MAKFVIDIDSDDSDTLHSAIELIQDSLGEVEEEIGVEIRLATSAEQDVYEA